MIPTTLTSTSTSKSASAATATAAQAGHVDPHLLMESPEDLYENAPCGYLSAQLQGNVLRVNRTLLAWLGYRRDEIAGKVSFQSLLTVPGKVFYEIQYVPLLILQGSVKEIAFDLVRKDGTPIPVLVNSTLRKDPYGRPLLQRTTVFNATDRRAYERELLLSRRQAEQAARALAQYLAMLGHDIKNPLGSILLAISGMKKRALTQDEGILAEVIESSAGHVLRVVNDILTYSQLEAGRLCLEERPFDPRKLVRSITTMFEGEAKHKGLLFRVHVGELVPPMVVGDATKLGQVLANLVGNAVKFTHKGEVSIDVDAVPPQDETVTLEWRVADTGIGIDRSRLGDIFEDFTQANPDIAKGFGGTGLGLAICRRILRLHGTSMHVESAPGQGSLFWFQTPLPVADT